MVLLELGLSCFCKFTLQDVNGVEAEKELEQESMAIFVIRPEGDPDVPPTDIGIVIEGCHSAGGPALCCICLCLTVLVHICPQLEIPQGT